MAEDLAHARKPLIDGFIPRLKDKKVTIRLISGDQPITGTIKAYNPYELLLKTTKGELLRYRYFLMSNAIDMGFKGFHARNRTGEKRPEVIALVEGDEEAIADFKALVETPKPEHSNVSSITFEDYQGDVMKTESYAQICYAIQLNKAIPVLLDIRDNTKKSLDVVKEESKGMREDIQPGYGMHFRQVQSDVRAIKERVGMQ